MHTNMVSMLNALIIMTGLVIGFSTGANDAANAMGTAVGAGVRTVKQAALLVAVFGLLGATLQGHTVTATLTEGLTSIKGIDPVIASSTILAAYLATGLWVTLTTFWGLPTSTSHSLVGALAGATLAMGSGQVNWMKFGLIGIAWILTPSTAATMSWILCRISAPIRGRERMLIRLWNLLLTLSGVYMAFAWGAAGVANIAGPLLITGMMSKTMALVLGGASIAAGVLVWGWRVMSTVGNDLVPLVPSTALISEISAAATVHFCASMGLPVSSSHATVGSVIGVGLSRRWRSANKLNSQLSTTIAAFWIATPLLCLVISFFFAKLFSFFVD